jgi:hypothetical protein
MQWLAIQTTTSLYDKRSGQLVLFSMDSDSRANQLLITVACPGCNNQLLLLWYSIADLIIDS